MLPPRNSVSVPQRLRLVVAFTGRCVRLMRLTDFTNYELCHVPETMGNVLSNYSQLGKDRHMWLLLLPVSTHNSVVRTRYIAALDRSANLVCRPSKI